MNDHSDTDDTNGDGEGVWSPDIEQCFREALILFPPCGRRKHILQDEGGGKMYGRNELIARHILMRTGKVRTRKQVSSHIQVLARRKAKADAAGGSSSPSSVTSGGGGSAIMATNAALINRTMRPHSASSGLVSSDPSVAMSNNAQPTPSYYDVWMDRPIVTKKIRLVEFSAFIEHRQHSIKSESADIQTTAGFTRHSYVRIDYRQPICRQTNKLELIDISQIQDKFPDIGGTEGLFQRGPSDAFYLVKFWADLNNDYEYNIDDQNSYFGFSSHFETVEPYKDITCSTKACSYGLQVVEKVEKIYGAFNSLNGRYSYDINRSPMCEFMIQFIKKLRHLPIAYQMNSVLENFTVLQVVTSESTSEILLCLAYVFEIAFPEQNKGPQYHVYKLTKD